MTLQTLADQHRNAILAREAQAATQITDQYQATFSRVLARLHWLFAQMSSAEHTGQAVNMAWLYQANRLQQALGQIQTEIHAFSLSASTTIHAQMSQAQQSGQQDAQTILQHALGKGQSVNEPQSQGGGGPSQHSDSIALRFAKLPIEAVKRAKVTLLAGIANGWGPLQIARQLQHDLSSQLNDALRVSRTEAMNAYRDSTLEVYRANGDTVVGWRWIAAADACPACTDLNGTRHDLSEDQEAPHPNCRCGQEPILASEGLD